MNVPTTHVFATVVIAVYGVIAIVGGLMGFLKGSIPSLVAGGICGLLLLVSAAGVFRRLPAASFIAAIVISLLLIGNFTLSLIHNRAELTAFLTTPRGIVAAVMISGGVIVVFFSLLALVTESRPPTLP